MTVTNNSTQKKGDTNMDKFYGVLFNRKSGKIIKVISGFSSALLRLFGIQGNVSATRDYVIFNNETGEIVFYGEGKKNDMPTIYEDMVGKNIDELCAGLREALKEEEQKN